MCRTLRSGYNGHVYGDYDMIKKTRQIVKILIKKKLSLSLAESCTGGLLSSLITQVSGSSKTLRFGLVTYSNHSKVKLLKVPKKIIKNFGAVSEQTCRYMLIGLSNILPTNLSVSITGIAGPRGGSKKKPVGLVYIGIKNKNKFIIRKFIFKNRNRKQIQNATANEAFKMLILLIK